MKRVLLLSLLSLVIFQVDAQVIKGKITENQNGQEVPVPFANVFILGETIGTTTDFDGNYTLNVGQGKYQLVASYVGYLSDTMSIDLSSGEDLELNIGLLQNSQTLKEFQVEAKVSRESETVLLMERKNAQGIEQNIGASELSKTGSSNVASGLKKVAGISVVGSSDIFVRGMGDRYNLAYLNGMPTPSSNPNKKVMPLNIFPSSIVSSLNVKKAFTPDLYGDFSGGIIDIRTKDFPDGPKLDVTFGTGFNSQTTGRDFVTYQGGKTDYFGMDDGTRAVPQDLNQIEYYNSVSEEGNGTGFTNNFNPTTIQAPLNTKYQITGGNYWKMKKLKHSGVGVMLSAYHSVKSQNLPGTYRVINAQNDFQLDYDYSDYQINTNSSGLANVQFRLLKNHRISANAIMVNQSMDNVREARGSHFDYGSLLFSRRFTFLENRLFTQQVKGEHDFLGSRLKVNWQASFSQANAAEPDRRQVIMFYQEGLPTTNYVFNSIDLNDNHRFYSALEENERSLKGEVSYALIFDDENDKRILDFTGGWNKKTKERDFGYRQFNYHLKEIPDYYPEGLDIEDIDAVLSDENHDQGAFHLEEFNAAPDYYIEQDINAYYGQFKWSPKNRWEVFGGLRMEHGIQLIKYPNPQQPILKEKIRLNQIDFLPSLIAKYETSEKTALRFSASKTITRASYYELAPFFYTDFALGIITRGNPDLNNSANYNLDLRYEIYPSAGELIAITAFGKSLENPIVSTMIAAPSGQIQTFTNAQSAYLTGVELEYKSKLSTLLSNDAVEDITIGMNASYIYSEMTLGLVKVNGVSVIQTNDDLALQGASPYLVNANISHQHEWGIGMKGSATLSYNIFGKRLSRVGVQGSGDIYELPVNTLNFVYSAEIKNKFKIGFSAKNILNPTAKFVQENKEMVLDQNSLRRGMLFGLSITYKIFN
jgi:hypothetical protein